MNFVRAIAMCTRISALNCLDSIREFRGANYEAGGKKSDARAG